jgi:CPA2 family monovalent cation:H+ antiporter-2
MVQAMNATHLPTLIEDLCLILAAAGIFTVLFRRLKQPTVLGYILAGMLIGPHFSLFPTVTDVANIKVWAEIGVIFLLFALGLEFSFRKLARVGGAASVTALVEVVAMVVIGFVTGRVLGWSLMDSLFLGGILSISSTTIIIRAFEETGMRARGFVNLVFGVLIVEDLIAILLLVLLSTIAISQSVAGLEMILALVKLGFFLTLWFVGGIFVLPSLMSRLRSVLTEETLLVVSIGLCFAMVVLSTKAGFSPALGAFLMGSLLAETHAGHRIEHLIKPVKDLFAAVFFVSVGMLIDPQVMITYAGPILAITVITILGKTLSTAFGVLVSGRSLRHAVQSGMSLAQIGEFSFIIAGLGVTLTVTSDFLYPIAVGVSAVTTFTTPYLILSADRIYRMVDARLPDTVKARLDGYAHAVAGISFAAEWWILLRAFAVRILTNAALITAIFSAVKVFAVPSLSAYFASPDLGYVLGFVVALTLSTPFLWAMVSGRIRNEAIERVLTDPEQRVSVFLFKASRWLIGLALLAFLSTQFITVKMSLSLTLGGVFLLMLVFSRQLERLYSRIERRFVKNLKGHDPASHLPPLAPWDAHLVSLEVDPTSALVGKTLMELRVRERFGITIALIERGTKKIPAPKGTDMLFPHDRIFVIGTDEEILKLRTQVETGGATEAVEEEEFNYVLKPVLIFAASPYCRRSVRDSGIREISHGLIVGIERHGRRILNPDSSMIIEPGDLLWVVGERGALRRLQSTL